MGEGKGFIAVYILASRRHGTPYVGVTSDLLVRIAQHREGTLEGFTKQYGVKLLVWFEEHTDIGAAIRREKAIKKYKRDWKINLIERENRIGMISIRGYFSNRHSIIRSSPGVSPGDPRTRSNEWPRLARPHLVRCAWVAGTCALAMTVIGVRV